MPGPRIEPQAKALATVLYSTTASIPLEKVFFFLGGVFGRKFCFMDCR